MRSVLILIVLFLPVPGLAQEQLPKLPYEQAGYVNYVEGDILVRGVDRPEWKELTQRDGVAIGDEILTATTGKLEMLLSPGAYLRTGPNTRIGLINPDFIYLQVRIDLGTALIEVTGPKDVPSVIEVKTPDGRFVILTHGLYRVEVGNETRLRLLSGLAAVGTPLATTKVKEGQEVVFSDGALRIASFPPTPPDDLERWSRERAEKLAAATRSLSDESLRKYASAVWKRRAFLDFPAPCGNWVPFAETSGFFFVPPLPSWRSPYDFEFKSLNVPCMQYFKRPIHPACQAIASRVFDQAWKIRSDFRYSSAQAGRVIHVTGLGHCINKNTVAQPRKQSVNDNLLRSGDNVWMYDGSYLEMELNPSSYLRAGPKTNFELIDADLSNLRIAVLQGSVIIEITRLGRSPLFVTVSVPKGDFVIRNNGRYRVTVGPDGESTVSVRGGRIDLSGGEQIGKGRKVTFGSAGRRTTRIDDKDEFDLWNDYRSRLHATRPGG